MIFKYEKNLKKYIRMKGIIYRIYWKEDIFLCYIGSTERMADDRWLYHKIQYKSWIKGVCNPVAIYRYMKEYGFENFVFEVLKEYDVVDTEHLQAYEQLWMNKLNTCVNINNVFTIDWIKKARMKEYSKKYHQKNKDKEREYRQKNKERDNENRKRYVEKNKEHIKDYQKKYGKEYKVKNKDKVIEKDAKYRENNRDKINEKAREKIECECGVIVTKGGLSSHRKSKKHFKLLNNS
jgi:group I intron endonuclease